MEQNTANGTTAKIRRRFSRMAADKPSGPRINANQREFRIKHGENANHWLRLDAGKARISEVTQLPKAADQSKKGILHAYSAPIFSELNHYFSNTYIEAQI